jgi:hypothetical protein
MSRRRVAAAALAALVAAACSAGPDAGGRLLVERISRGSARLLDDPGQATYCAAESLLTVVAVGRSWSGGLAMRVTLPVRAAVTLQVRRSLGGYGTATAAFRPAGGVARLGVSGAITLAPSSGVEGAFEVTVTDSAPPDAVVRGRLSRMVYTEPSGPPCRP